MDMRFYWIKDRVQQKQFHIYWKPGKFNKADYFTKHHPAAHHCNIHSAYLHNKNMSSKNYFKCLAEADPAEQPASGGDGEGVFMTWSVPVGAIPTNST